VNGLFERAGYLVETAGTFKDSESLVNSKVFDVAIICLQMPNGDGLNLLSFIRQFSPQTVCIVLTALDLPKTREKAKSLGAAAYLLKPIFPEDLLRIVEEKLKDNK
jgi:DNA-binding response OmpR family regulator